MFLLFPQKKIRSNSELSYLSLPRTSCQSTHDLDYVARYADHVVLLDKTVLRQGTVKEVYESSEFERIFSAGKEETWIKEDETND